MTLNPKTILTCLAIIFAATSYIGWPTLGVSVILLGVCNFL
jgi:hypothetical protein